MLRGIRDIDDLSGSVSRYDADNEVEPDEGGDNSARVNRCEIGDVVKYSAQNEVVGEGVDWSVQIRGSKTYVEREWGRWWED